MSHELFTARLRLSPVQIGDMAQLLAYERRTRITHAAHGPQRTDAEFTEEA